MRKWLLIGPVAWLAACGPAVPPKAAPAPAPQGATAGTARQGVLPSHRLVTATESRSGSAPASQPVQQRPQPALVLYRPAVEGDNLVSVTGHVSGPRASRTVSVYIYDGKGKELASARVPLSGGGFFSAWLHMKVAQGGLKRLYIGARYSGAPAQGLRLFDNLIAFRGTFPSPVASALQSISKATTFPIEGPTWLPQALAARRPTRPYVSIAGAAKSFTYEIQLRMTPQMDPYNAPAVEADANPAVADIQGDHFGSHTAAVKRLTFHLNQVRPSLHASRTVGLGGTRRAAVYSDRWHTVIWRQDGQLVLVRGPSRNQNIEDAVALSRRLSVYPLPPGGVVWLRNIAVGQTQTGSDVKFETSYVVGATLYDVDATGPVNTESATTWKLVERVLHLASSMKGVAP